MPGARESDQGYNSYVGSCSVHGTLKRHISSGVDTTFEVTILDIDEQIHNEGLICILGKLTIVMI